MCIRALCLEQPTQLECMTPELKNQTFSFENEVTKSFRQLIVSIFMTKKNVWEVGITILKHTLERQ